MFGLMLFVFVAFLVYERHKHGKREWRFIQIHGRPDLSLLRERKLSLFFDTWEKQV